MKNCIGVYGKLILWKYFWFFTVQTAKMKIFEWKIVNFPVFWLKTYTMWVLVRTTSLYPPQTVFVVGYTVFTLFVIVCVLLDK